MRLRDNVLKPMVGSKIDHLYTEYNHDQLLQGLESFDLVCCNF